MDRAILQRALKSDDPAVLVSALKLAADPLFRFDPRPDKPDEFDQQSTFYHDRFPGLACVLGGTGSGKSHVGAAKVAAFLRNTPPPEPDTPFWVLSKTMDMASANCWGQNLSHFIPKEIISGYVWYRKERNLPRSIILRPHANGGNYVIELKSYDMDREALQAANTIGFWCDEQVPYDILIEIWSRTRKWTYPGSKVYTLTPLEPDPQLEDIYKNPPASWRFYRMSTRCNASLAPDFVTSITENEIGVLVETRLTGAFARFEGAIYPEFDPAVHVIDPFDLPPQWLRVRGLDLGWSHATACVWAARDLQGTYHVYREYLESKTSIEDHVKSINDDWDDVLVRGHTYADPAAAQTLYEFALRGVDTVAANKNVHAGIATMQSLLRPHHNGRPRLLVFKTCPQLIQQLRSYVWDSNSHDKPLKVNDDLVDSCRYMVHSHRMDTSIEVKPLKQPERRKVPM